MSDTVVMIAVLSLCALVALVFVRWVKAVRKLEVFEEYQEQEIARYRKDLSNLRKTPQVTDEPEALNEACSQLLDMGFSTGHGDSFRDLTFECIGNLRSMRDELDLQPPQVTDDQLTWVERAPREGWYFVTKPLEQGFWTSPQVEHHSKSSGSRGGDGKLFWGPLPEPWFERDMRAALQGNSDE